MTAQLLYFAGLADRLGRTAETAALPPEVTTVRALLAWLRDRGGAWSTLADEGVRVTVNKQFGVLDTPIKDGDEIALVPKRAGP